MIDQLIASLGRPPAAIARFDLDAAAQQAVEAVIHWTTTQITSVMLGGVTEDDLYAAYTRMQTAAAIWAWEQGRAAAAAAFPGPHYDDETIQALLGRAWA